MFFVLNVSSIANSRQQHSISGIKVFCQQSLLPQDDISDVFLRMVKLVFDYAINVTADVLLSNYYVKLLSWIDCSTRETGSRTEE
nr:hypothetical protein BgiMline_023971 [Biomphalaria glabrata]